MPFEPLTQPPQAVTTIPTPAALFGTDFRCIYLHDDGKFCGHKSEVPHWFCVAHINTPIEGDVALMGGPRLVRTPNASYRRTATAMEMAAHIQWVVGVKRDQVAEMQALVDNSFQELRFQEAHVGALQDAETALKAHVQEQINAQRPAQRMLRTLRKVLS